MKKSKRKQIEQQIINLRKLDVIINNKIIDGGDEDLLDNWVTDTDCGSKGCVLGDYVLNGYLTEEEEALCGIIRTGDKIIVTNRQSFGHYCDDLDVKSEFGKNFYKLNDVDPDENADHPVFQMSEGLSFEDRLTLVRKTIKKLSKKLNK